MTDDNAKLAAALERLADESGEREEALRELAQRITADEPEVTFNELLREDTETRRSSTRELEQRLAQAQETDSETNETEEDE